MFHHILHARFTPPLPAPGRKTTHTLSVKVNLSDVKCHLSNVKRHFSSVKCHLSDAKCHLMRGNVKGIGREHERYAEKTRKVFGNCMRSK